MIQEDIKNGKATPETLAKSVMETIQSIISSGKGTVKGISSYDSNVDYGNCPDCGKPLQQRKGKYGAFIACSGYPSCTYIKKNKRKVVGKCPDCGKDLVERKGKSGIFYGCSNYPTCKYTRFPTGRK